MKRSALFVCFLALPLTAYAQVAATMAPPAPAPAPAPASEPAQAAASPMPMPHRAMSFQSNAPSTQGYKDAMDKMMAGMEAPYTGDADRDFVVNMIPHHQGAIDMAEIELKYGKDPKIKALSGRIIAGQERDIELMKTWLAKHPEKHIGDNPHIQAK